MTDATSPSHSSSRIVPQNVIPPDDYAAIDRFAHDHPGEHNLSAWAEFLQQTFALDLLLDADIVKGFSSDSSNLPGRAEAVCRPCDERECAILLRACHSAGIPCTVSAGKSNLTGSATPAGGIILSTVRMTSPAAQVDEASRIVKAPVGVILEDLRNQVLEQTAHRLEFPVNPTSRTDATLGGALACNASGFTPGEAGAIRSWVHALDVLLPNGHKVSASYGSYVTTNGFFIIASPTGDIRLPVPCHPCPPIKNTGGPWSNPDGVMDFMDLIIGSEGIFGVVTASELKLQLRPADYFDLFFSLPSEAAAVDLLDFVASRLEGKMDRLSALEYFGINCRRFMNHEKRLFHGTDPVAIYIQTPIGPDTPNGVSTDEAAEVWLDILSASGCGINEDAILLLDNDRDRTVFLEARHSLPANSLEVVQRRGTFTMMTDTVVPRARFREFLDYTHGLLAAEQLDYVSFGHLGDCHLHFSILPERSQLERATEVYTLIIACSAALGGVYSGEHGTGKRKRADFLACHGAAAAAGIRACKAALDPRFLLNRGNVIVDAGVPA